LRATCLPLTPWWRSVVLRAKQLRGAKAPCLIVKQFLMIG
jgi:hypothetical protein